eukprot:1516511-Pyramimonas_sp.AAC.1
MRRAPHYENGGDPARARLLQSKIKQVAAPREQERAGWLLRRSCRILLQPALKPVLRFSLSSASSSSRPRSRLRTTSLRSRTRRRRAAYPSYPSYFHHS